MDERCIFRALAVLTALTLSGCSASMNATRLDQQLSAFAAAFARQILAAFLL